jgi:hypothetical protein
LLGSWKDFVEVYWHTERNKEETPYSRADPIRRLERRWSGKL